MFATDDTIVAIATPAGPGAIGVVRLSGPGAVAVAAAVLRITSPLRPRRATLTEAVDPADGRPLDRVLVTHFPGPASYTGDDVVEISAHGSPVVLRQIVAATMTAGARLAAPGEFTFRAYLNGRIDLVQAEAVADLVEAVTPGQARAAFDQLEGTLTGVIGDIDRTLFDLIARLEASLDFPDEGYHFIDREQVAKNVASLTARVSGLLAAAERGRLLREGAEVVILGTPNVGKSTLFNRLCGAARAIVTDVAGTTRDLLTERIDLGGIPVTLVDTAGLRAAADVVEAEGVSRARGALAVASAVVVVVDRSRPLGDDDRAVLDDTRERPRLVVASKCDHPAAWTLAGERAVEGGAGVVEACLHDDEAVVEIRDRLTRVLEGSPGSREAPAITNRRHIHLLGVVRSALGRAAAAAAGGAAEELVLVDLSDARAAVEEITGRRAADAVLERIFERFCIGK